VTRALLALSVVTALAAAPAHAGTYDVWSCAGPGGEPLPATGWSPQSRGGTISSTCGRFGGAMSGSLSTSEVPVGSFARWTFEAPPNTTIVNTTVQRAAGSSGVATWYRSYFLFRDSPVPDVGYGMDVCAQLAGPCARPGSPALPFDEVSRFTSGAFSAGKLIASAQCDGQGTCPAQPPATAGWFSIYRVRIGLTDAYPPAFLKPPSGTLLDTSSTATGERVVQFDGRDLGAGLRSGEIVVDGTAVADSPIAAGASCREPYNLPAPCPPTASGTIALDTATIENGQRRVQVALVDAAGNRTLSDPVTVSVHNDKLANGTPASRTAHLTARFRTRTSGRAVERTIGFGRSARVVGRLVDTTGSPIAGAHLSVTSRLDRLGATERDVATVTTNANGRFRWRTTAGPSRLLRIGYRAYRSDERLTAFAELKLGVRPAIALSVRPRQVRNGGRVRFRGRLLGGPGRARTQVVLEAVGRRGRQRVPVATLRAGRDGRFRFSYRFLRSFAPFTYRFRARLIPQASYPYAAGASPAVVVRIVR
jgi:hypothetical protein